MNGLYEVSKTHSRNIENIKLFKNIFLEKFSKHLVWEEKNQPLLCTKINLNIKKKIDNTVLYEPRDKSKGNIICHLHAFDGKGIEKLYRNIDFY